VISEAVNVADDEIKSRGVRYTNMVPVLIKAIQDQQGVIDAQREAMKAQEARLQRLENALLK
jgi:hypothetical protein